MEAPQAYLMVAFYLQKLFQSLISAKFLYKRYVDEDERYKNIHDYARTCLQLAAPHLPVAYTELAKHHAADSEEKYAWLFSAAYPETGDVSEILLLMLLAERVLGLMPKVLSFSAIPRIKMFWFCASV